MKNPLVSLAATTLLVALGTMASAAPYDAPRDQQGSRDGAGLPGLPGGRGGKSGFEQARDDNRGSQARAGDVRLRRYCSDLLRRRSPRADDQFQPRDCEDWFAQLDRKWVASREGRGSLADGNARGASDGQNGPSIQGGSGGQGGAAGTGPGAADGGNGGPGVQGGTGGAGGRGGSGF